ncbi:MAG: hypothetical protein ING08_19570, partial [Roseomonas sp.]|nr:hypothetical protein [Roseomonas sp.]
PRIEPSARQPFREKGDIGADAFLRQRHPIKLKETAKADHDLPIKGVGLGQAAFQVATEQHAISACQLQQPAPTSPHMIVRLFSAMKMRRRRGSIPAVRYCRNMPKLPLLCKFISMRE